MSNYPYGRRPNYTPPTPNHPTQSPQPQYDTYGSQPGYPDPSGPIHRTSSFDAGDDAALLDSGQGQAQAVSGRGEYPPYRGSSSAGSQRGQHAAPAGHNPLPYRSGSYGTGYQHQNEPASPPARQPSVYNPSLYSQTQQQPQYAPQAYGASQQSYSTSSPQAYNPAAYQPANVQRQPSLTYGQPSYYNPPGNYNPLQAPAPPPRPGDLAYNPQTATFGNYEQDRRHQPSYGQPAAPEPPPRSSYYTSAPDPPAHVQYDDRAPAAPRPYSHEPSNSQVNAYSNHPLHSPLNEHSALGYSNSHVARNPSFTDRVSNISSSGLSPPSSIPSPPSRNTSHTSPQRTNTLGRHPQERPLPGPPSESESDNDYFPGQNGGGARHSTVPEETGYDDLMREVDAAITQGRSGTVAYSAQHSATQATFDQDALFAPDTPQPLITPDEAPTHVNGTIASSGGTNINYGAFSDESDAEAAAGLAAMQAAEEQEAAENRRRSGSASLFSASGSQRQSERFRRSTHDVSSDSDYANVDMGLVGGGFEGHMQYGQDSHYAAAAAAAMPESDSYNRLNPQMHSIRSSGRSSEGRESDWSGYESIPAQDFIHPFPPFRHTDIARVDTGGTGGLTEPSPHPRRLSFEDGDEATLADPNQDRMSGSVSPSKDSMPDLFYHPGMSPSRPLPPAPSASDPGSRLPHLIPAGTYGSQSRQSQYEHVPRPYPVAPDAYDQTLLSPGAVPRSTSLSSTRSQPKLDQPIRAKTDADRAKLLRQQMGGRPASDGYDSSVPQSAVMLDLPTIPRKKFNPGKLSTEQYKRCTEPWALSSIVAWIRDLADEESDLREHAVVEAIVALFTHKVPTMNTADAEMLGERVVRDMFTAEALVKDEEWVKFGLGTMTGVIFQLTGTGCYSPKVHVHSTKGRCYSHHCMRTLKKVDLSLPMESEKKSEDWATYYGLKKDDLEGHEKKEIERQNILHEVVTTEMLFITHLDVLRVLYRDTLARAQPPILQAKKLDSFLSEVFGNVDEIKKVNQDYLLAQLKYRQNEQGPWVVGYSDIFREWIRKAKSKYVAYAAGFPRANYLVRREAERNLLFKQFLDQARDDKRSNRLSWDTYLKDPITRLQRYGLLLQSVHKNMIKDSEEKMNLQFAIDEVRAATFECNAKVDEMDRKMALVELSNKIRLRKGMEREVELNLDHLGREVLIRGDLQRAGGKGFQWVDMHAILFDHYLVLAKTVITRDSAGGRKYEIYDVSKVPIPMDLIVLESTNDAPVVKSVKGIGAVTTSVTPRGQMNSDPRLARTTSTQSGGPGGITHTATSTSLSSKETAQSVSMVTATVLEQTSRDEKIMYPFRVKHLGKSETYTLYAPTAQNRSDWCEAIIEAKTRHAASLYAQNAEPFRLKVLADTAFGYEGIPAISKRIVIRGTPLDRAIREAESQYDGQSRPGPVCRAAVNCATVFNQPYGRLMCAVGTDFGVFISEYHNPRGWTRAIQMNKVTQIAVFEEFNLFLLIADKALIAYHLDVVCPPTGTAAPSTNDASSRRAPQKLSGAKDVGFFATGRMKDRALVFYKKRDGISSTFKVLEPVLQKATTTRRFMPTSTRRGQTEFFREYDEFYIPAECYSINLFHSSLAISTSRGVEVLTLDKKQPWTVPNLRSDSPDTQAHLSSIASRIKDLRPLGMFRLGEAEFLVAFEECAVYVNKHGDVSRGVVMEFVGRAKTACLYGQHLVLFDDDFIEIRNAMNGRLKQVIAGKDIKMLDDGGGGNTAGGAAAPAGLGGGANGLGLQNLGTGQRTVKICMQHPDYERSHVLVELLENEVRKE